MSLVLSIHRVMADLCCGSSQNKLQLSKSKFRWLFTRGCSVCAQVGRAALSFARQAVLGSACRALLQFSQCRDRIWREKWWIGWSVFMSWFLGPGSCRAKWGQGRISIFSCDYPSCFLCFYMMMLRLCSQGRALLNSPSWPSLIRLVLPSSKTRGKAKLYRFCLSPKQYQCFSQAIGKNFRTWFSHLFLSPSAALKEAFVAECKW